MGKTQLRVNLGSGADYKDGWVNVDVSAENKVDLIADLSKRFPFEDNSVNELFASDILEHFTKEQGKIFLEECYRVLKVDGKITIRTHNIYQIYQQFYHDPDVMIHFMYGNTSDDGIFGAHKYAYTYKSLTLLLKKIGFEVNSFTKETTNFVVLAMKKKIKTQKLKIGIIQQSPDLGGAETYLLSLIDHFIKENIDIYFACNEGKLLDRAKERNIKIFELPFILDIMGNYRGLIKSILLLPAALIFYSRLLSMFKKNNVNVILMSGFTEKLLVSFLSHFFGIPVVWIEYGPLKTIFTRLMHIPKIAYRLSNQFPKALIVPSKNTQMSMIVDCRVSSAKLHVIPCGIPIPKKVSSTRKVLPATLNGRFIIGNVSRLTREKGQDYLIKAMSDVIHKIPKAHLLIIGDGPDKEYYQKLIKELNIEKNVTIAGFVQNLQDYYSAMDIFVFPTVWDLEGFGLVTPEAMAHKLPVIGSNMGPVPEIIDDGKTGLLVPPKDKKAIADAIISLYKNSHKRKEFGKKGYEKAKKLYNIEKASKKILEVLTDASYSSKI